MPGKSVSRWRAMMSSSGTNMSGAMRTKRGSTSFGTFTRANVSARETGSRSHTASESDRFEMYGKGRPGPTASGVSTGKICSAKMRSIARELVALAARAVDYPDSVLRERRAQLVVPGARMAGAELARALIDPLQRLAGREPVHAAHLDAGVDLVVEAGHSHHDELVEV